MNVYDEKDYIMRIIKEMVRVLFSLMLGKQYVKVELPAENKYNISGTKLDDLIRMIDHGEINEAENLILSDIDYNNKNEVIAGIYFYQHLSGKTSEFLAEHNYSREEILDGLKMLAKNAGYGDLNELLDESTKEDFLF